MNPPCARCGKTVYVTEKLSCLDKPWHKKCFSCETCKTMLTMKTYKGYNKLPYCTTHYPTTSFTAVADTPEGRRLAGQTKAQSSVAYHAEYEKTKGAFTAVADDPATVAAKRNTQQQSKTAYDQRDKMEVHQQRVSKSADDDVAEEAAAPAPVAVVAEPEPEAEAEREPEAEAEAEPEPVAEAEPEAAPEAAVSGGGAAYTAQFDYEAADEDEVSFNEGDRIIDVEVIDDGWMKGTVEKSGKRGMLPSNYVEPE